MKRSPTGFSIITPTFNRADLIAKSLESVKAQTYRPIEMIVIDDGSTDDTAEVVQKWTDQNSEGEDLSVKYFFQENAGQSAARNRGIEQATGKYVQFLDSDDFIAASRLEKIADLFDSDDQLDFVQTGFEGFCGDCGMVLDEHFGNPDVEPLVQACRGRLWANTLRSAFRRSALADVRWNTEMTCFEDYEFVVRTLFHTRRAIAIREVLASARRSGGPRVSDTLRSYDGRRQRIMCEAALVKGVKTRKDIPEKERAALASRIYALGLRSLASGWRDHATSCLNLANQLDVDLDSLGRRRKMVLRAGRFPSLCYQVLGKIKTQLRGGNPMSTEHKCVSNS